MWSKKKSEAKRRRVSFVARRKNIHVYHASGLQNLESLNGNLLNKTERGLHKDHLSSHHKHHPSARFKSFLQIPNIYFITASGHQNLRTSEPQNPKTSIFSINTCPSRREPTPKSPQFYTSQSHPTVRLASGVLLHIARGRYFDLLIIPMPRQTFKKIKDGESLGVHQKRTHDE